MIRLALIVAASLPLGGCFLAVVGGAGAEAGYVGAQKDRKAGETMSDQWIHSKAKAALLANGKVRSGDINVDVFKGVVTLRGFVRTAEQRREAVETVRKIKGVVSVDDKLALTP